MSYLEENINRIILLNPYEVVSDTVNNIRNKPIYYCINIIIQFFIGRKNYAQTFTTSKRIIKGN